MRKFTQLSLLMLFIISKSYGFQTTGLFADTKVYSSGSVFSSMTKNTSAGTASIAVKTRFNDWLNINIGITTGTGTDTISNNNTKFDDANVRANNTINNYGTFLIRPNSTPGAFIDLRTVPLFFDVIGVKGTWNTGLNRVWKYTDNTNDVFIRNADISTLAFGLYFGSPEIKIAQETKDEKQKTLQFMVDVLLSSRWITNDLGKDENGFIRQLTLGTKKNIVTGGELIISIKYNDITIFYDGMMFFENNLTGRGAIGIAYDINLFGL